MMHIVHVAHCTSFGPVLKLRGATFKDHPTALPHESLFAGSHPKRRNKLRGHCRMAVELATDLEQVKNAVVI
jgi:hypothetical protein